MQYFYPTKDPYVTQKFGANPQVYAQFGMKGHNGTDYRAKYVDVFAAQDGAVSTASNPKGYGNYIKIAHSDGSMTLYGHLSKFLVANGQKVKMGQKIGVSGNTGFSTAPHLHFGLRPKNFNQNNGYAGYIDNAPYMTSTLPTNPPTGNNSMALQDVKIKDLPEVEFNKMHDVANAQYPGWTSEMYNKNGKNAFKEYQGVPGLVTLLDLNNYFENKPEFIAMRKNLQAGGGTVDKAGINSLADQIKHKVGY